MRPQTGPRHSSWEIGATAAPRREATAAAHSAPKGWTRERRLEFEKSLMGSISNLGQKFGLSRDEAARQAAFLLRELGD